MTAAKTWDLSPASWDGVIDFPGAGSLSGGLWGDAPIGAMLADPAGYTHFFDDFLEFEDDTRWTSTAATAGTAAISAAAGGILVLDSASATQGQGIQIQLASSPFTLAAGKKLWFETRLKLTDTVGGAQFFAGLSVIDTSIIASNVISSTEYLGWYGVGTAALECQANSGGTAVNGTTQTIVEDTYINLGFKVDGVTSYQPYVNGVALGDEIDLTGTDNLPTGALAPSFVCQTNGTVDPIVSLDWVRVLAQR